MGGTHGLLNTFLPHDGQAFAGRTAWLVTGSGDLVPGKASAMSSPRSKPCREHQADHWALVPSTGPGTTRAHVALHEAGDHCLLGSYSYKDKPTHLQLAQRGSHPVPFSHKPFSAF